MKGQGIVWKDIFRVLLKLWIFGESLCDRVYFWRIFHATGYMMQRDLPHIPVTALVKYPPRGDRSKPGCSFCFVASVRRKSTLGTRLRRVLKNHDDTYCLTNNHSKGIFTCFFSSTEMKINQIKAQNTI